MDLLITIITVVGIFFLGRLVLLSNRKSATANSFILFCFTQACWTIVNYISLQSKSPETTLFWVRLVMFFAVTLGLSLFLFIYCFPRQVVNFSPKQVFIVGFPAVVAMVTALSPFLFVRMNSTEFGFSPVPGPGITVFIITFLGYLSSGIIVFYNKYRTATGLFRQQLKYLLFGCIFLLLALFVSNFLLVVLFNNTRFISFGPLFILFFIGTAAYAIIRYRLMDIQVVIKRSVMFSTLLAITVGIYAVSILALQKLVLMNSARSSEYSGIIATLILVVTIDPLKKLIEKTTERVFFRTHYDVQSTVLSLSKSITETVSLQAITDQILETLNLTLKPRGVGLWLVHKKSGVFDPIITHPIRHVGDIALVTKTVNTICRLAHEQGMDELCVTDELALSIKRNVVDPRLPDLVRMLEQSGIAIYMPLIRKNEFSGAFFLRGKRSDNAYTKEDIRFLDLVAHQASIAIDNALLYTDLEARVDERTAQVREKNRDLTTLQQVSTQVIQSIDFQVTIQNIINAAHADLAYAGALYLSYEAVTGDIRLAAHSQNKEVVAAFGEIVTIDAFRGNTETLTCVSDLIKTRKTVIVEKLSELISPAISARSIGVVQKALRAKSAVAMPVAAEGDVFGIIVYLLEEAPPDIQRSQVEMMEALAHLLAIVTRNGRYFQEIQDSNKKLQNAYQMINDQLKQLEEANKHLQKLDKAKSEFLSIASHQLRTPLSAIRGYLSLLEDGDYGALTEKQNVVLGKTEDNVKRLVALVNDLLSLARIEAGTGPKGLSLNTIDLCGLIDMVAEELMVNAKNRDIELIWKRPASAVLAEVDKEKFEQVVMNLIDNAIDYTLEGSVTVNLSEIGKAIVFSVTDTGIGIEPDVIDNLFTKFYRASDAVKVRPDGTGIGLYVCKTVVESHHGKVWVESQRGKGTTFFVELPKKQPKLKAGPVIPLVALPVSPA